MESTQTAVGRGDSGPALELVERALETEGRLGPYPSTLPGLARIRESVATRSGALLEGAKWWETAAAQARGAGLFGVEVTYLAGTVFLMSSSRPSAQMRELLAQGEAMDRDQSTAYARTHIDDTWPRSTAPSDG